MTHTLHLIDASPYIFRAFFSLPDSIRDPAGAPVNAVYGFAGFLLRLVEDERPTHLAVAFDHSLTSSFRNEIYPLYKAQRTLPPRELEAQLDACRQLTAGLGMATYIDDHYEADDLLAGLVRRATTAGHRVVVVSSDKDLAALVTADVELLDFARGERYDVARVEAKFGVRPEQIVDYLALAGDTVDNIPGVPGIGKKTAAALLSALGSLDAMYADLDQVATLPLRGARSLGAKLAEHREQAFLSRRLATLADDRPAELDVDALEWSGARASELDPLLARWGFDGIRARIPRWRED